MAFYLLLIVSIWAVVNAVTLPSTRLSSLTPTLTLAPASRALLARCDDGDCTFGGAAETLKADTVTTTVLSTTSVPCYITTYVTDSTTTTSTVYSTDTITSTITQEGTVTVIKYQPTPVLKTSTYESVTQITQTATSVWLESQGSAYESTITGDTKTIGGGVGQSTDDDISYQSHDNDGGWKVSDGAGVPLPAAGATVAGASAWTHATAAGAVAGVGATAIGANAATGTTGGWAAAVNGNGAVVTGAAGATVNANGVAVNWNGGRRRQDDSSTVLVVAAATMTIVLFKYRHYFS